MALQIKCVVCGKKFWVDGHQTPDSFTDPGETIISDFASFEDCCEHIRETGSFDVTDYEMETFSDDVI